MPPKPRKQELHYRCTISQCGWDFKNADELAIHGQDFHTPTNRSLKILPAPSKPKTARKDTDWSTDSDNSTYTITTTDTEITKGSQSELNPSMAYLANKEGGGNMMVPEQSSLIPEDYLNNLTNVVQSATRRTWVRWVGRMNRDTMANPGASEWKNV